MSVVSQDLREFLQILGKHNVEFLLVGGHAMAVHGVPRYTKDLDIWLTVSAQNATNVLRALAEFGFGNVGITAEHLQDPDAVIQLGYEPNRVDLLTGIDGVSFAEAIQDSLPVVFAGTPIRVISRKHLIVNKRTVARPRDLVDAVELEKYGS
jgi:Nucleotidyl transferase of unknown function (DUF2204)